MGLLSRLTAAPLLRTYFVTSPSSCVWELGGEEGNSRLSPPFGFDIIITVTVLVELACVDNVGVISTFGVALLTFIGVA